MKGFQKVRTLIARVRKLADILRTLISGHKQLRSGHVFADISVGEGVKNLENRNVRRTLIVNEPIPI